MTQFDTSRFWDLPALKLQYKLIMSIAFARLIIAGFPMGISLFFVQLSTFLVIGLPVFAKDLTGFSCNQLYPAAKTTYKISRKNVLGRGRLEIAIENKQLDELFIFEMHRKPLDLFNRAEAIHFNESLRGRIQASANAHQFILHTLEAAEFNQFLDANFAQGSEFLLIKNTAENRHRVDSALRSIFFQNYLRAEITRLGFPSSGKLEIVWSDSLQEVVIEYTAPKKIPIDDLSDQLRGRFSLQMPSGVPIKEISEPIRIFKFNFHGQPAGPELDLPQFSVLWLWQLRLQTAGYTLNSEKNGDGTTISAIRKSGP